MHPFTVNDETKAMVLENIRFLLNNFLRCTAYETVIFSWVLHRQEIIDGILGGLDLSKECEVAGVSLLCSEEELCRRLLGDIAAGRRTEDVLGRSLAYLPLYTALNTRKLDVTALSPEETAEALSRL